MPRTIFRVFLSSTFGDFQAEREKLRAEVWPRLEALCAAHGASFHVVDLRWGISPSVATTHDTIKICLDEVIRCQQLSPRPKPNFLMLIGDRYGWRPPAVQIPDVDFKQIRKAVSSDDAAFLEEWYRRDDNAVPPVWCLKPRTGEYSSYDVWGPVESRLTKIFHDVTDRLGLAPEQFLYSATHMEIVSGLLQLEEAKDHVFSFNREISGLPDPAPKGIARRFTDHIGDGTRDPESRKLLQVLKAQIAEVLPESQIHTFVAGWIGEESKPITLNHLDDYCGAIEQSLRGIIDAEVKELAQSTPLQDELELQQQFLEETGTLLIGRDNELKKIQAYLQRKKTPLPLIVRATGGAGKSALLAKVAMSQQGESGTLIYRFIGAAPRSWQPQTFLQDLITQIAEAFGQPEPDLPVEGGIKKIAELFHKQLELATAEQPLTLFIDAIDQFNSTSPVQYADIFPKQLPANVRMIISILEGKDSEQLEKLYPKAPLIHLEQLSPTACGKILAALLPGRMLTKEQKNAILDKAKVSGLPLWLTLVAPIARKLSSWDEPPNLPSDIKELARYVIKKIADKHNPAITTASLRYIKLARFGLSETELQEILWKDPEVWKEFDDSRNKDQPDVSALPPVFWSRLYAELDPYINEYWMDGQLLHRYFHRVFGEVADEMDETTRTTLHSRLADYFASQPLYNKQHPNGRKLMEQAWHLTLAGRIEDARTFITNFDNAMAKCRLNRSDDWAEDFRRASQGEKSRDYQLWESFVKTNVNILRRGNDDWPSNKILLQLAIEHADDSPATIEAEKFLADDKCDWAWLRRELRVDHSGVSNCVAVFDGHNSVVNGAQMLADGRILSWSDDGTLRIWDMESGTCLKTMEGHIYSVTGALQVSDGQILSWSERSAVDNSFRLWSSNGEPLRAMEGLERCVEGAQQLTDGRLLSWSGDNSLRLWSQEGVPIRVMAGHTSSVTGVQHLPDGRLLSWSTDNTLTLWSSEGESLRVMEEHTDEVNGVLQLSGGQFLSWSKDNTLRLWNSDGELLKVLEGHTDVVKGALLLPEERLLTWSEDSTLRLWTSDGEQLKIFEGHDLSVDGALPLADGRILSWSGDTTLRLWNSDGEQLKILVGHRDNVNGVLLLPDGRFLSWSDDRTIRLWNTDGEFIKYLLGHSDNICGVLQASEQRFLSWSKDNTLRFWQLDGEYSELVGHYFPVEGFLSMPNGRFLSWTATHEFWYLLWNNDGKLFKVLDEHTSYINGALQLSDGRFLSWSWDSTLRIWNSDGESLKVLEGHKDVVDGVLLLPDGHFLSWSYDSTLRLWSAEGELIRVLEGHTSSVYGAQLLPDGCILSWEAHLLRLWSHTGEELLVLENGHTLGSIIKNAKQLSDGRFLSWDDSSLILWSKNGEILKEFSAENFLLLPDGRLLTWDMFGWTVDFWSPYGELLTTLENNPNLLLGALHLSNGRFLAWFDDYSLRLLNYNLDTINIMAGHTDNIDGALLLHDGRLLSWAQDHTIRLWSATGEPIKSYHRSELLKFGPEVWMDLLPPDQQTPIDGISSYRTVVSIGSSYNHLLFWQAQSKCTARHLYNDGRAIVTQENGQVCFLQTYHGNRRIQLDVGE